MIVAVVVVAVVAVVVVVVVAVAVVVVAVAVAVAHHKQLMEVWMLLHEVIWQEAEELMVNGVADGEIVAVVGQVVGY